MITAALTRGWWCVVILRNIPCTNSETGAHVDVEDVLSVYGPFTKEQAYERVRQFNLVHDEADDGSPRYRPVSNAPDFLHAGEWDEHWAVARPMNDIVW